MATTEDQIKKWAILVEDGEKLYEYENFYRKTSPRRLFNRGNGYQLSRLFKSPISEQVANVYDRQHYTYSLNDPNRLTKLIRENESEMSFISDALIKTYSSQTVKKKYVFECGELIPKELVDLKNGQIGEIDNADGRIIDDMECTGGSSDYPHLITFKFPFYLDDIQTLDDAIGTLTDTIYVTGYNFSSARHSKPKIQPLEKEIAIILISFEAKFNESEFKFSEFLYHVTPYSHLQKIRNRGLVPYSKSDSFKYPDRVYLFNMISTSQLRNYGLEKAVDENRFCVLKINSEKLQNHSLYRNGKMKFYVDGKYVNDDDGKPQAIFTYGNIPRELIENEVDVYETDPRGEVVISKHTEEFNESE